MDNEERCRQELSYISKYIGQDEDLVQAGGGNTSIKIDERRMLVKSSGVELSAVTEVSGISVVDYRQVRDALTSSANDDDVLKDALIEGSRPSIETYLHSLTDKYTIHSHPLCVTILASQIGGMDVLSQMFPEAVCVNYAKPGLDLAKNFLLVSKKKPSASVFFLKNHGLIVCAGTKEEVLKRHDVVIDYLCKYLGIPQDASIVAKRLFEDLQSWDNGLIAYYMEKISARNLFRNNGKSSFMFSPDCVVYCGMELFVVKKLDLLRDELNAFVKEYGMPKVAVINDLVFAIAPSVRKAKDIEGVLGLVVKINQRKKENIDYLSKGNALELLDWESEKYRFKL